MIMREKEQRSNPSTQNNNPYFAMPPLVELSFHQADVKVAR